MSIKKATLDEHICGELNNIDGVVSGKQEENTQLICFKSSEEFFKIRNRGNKT